MENWVIQTIVLIVAFGAAVAEAYRFGYDKATRDILVQLKEEAAKFEAGEE